jgi:transposase InsO family protein
MMSADDGGTVDVLARLFTVRGVPFHIRSDNGPEHPAKAMREWLGRVGVRTLFIARGKGLDQAVEKGLQHPSASRRYANAQMTWRAVER